MKSEMKSDCCNVNLNMNGIVKWLIRHKWMVNVKMICPHCYNLCTPIEEKPRGDLHE